MKLWLISLSVLILFLVTTCGVATPETPVAQPPPATSTNTPAVVAATHTPAAEPTQVVVEVTITKSETVIEPTPTATAGMAIEVAPTSEVVDWLTVEGKTADNLTYLGNPDAPVTLIDYSDFL